MAKKILEVLLAIFATIISIVVMLLVATKFKVENDIILALISAILFGGIYGIGIRIINRNSDK